MKKVIVTLLASLTLIGCGSGQTTSEPTIEAVEPVIESKPLRTIPTIVPEKVEYTPVVKEPEYEIVINEKEATALAQMAWGEARGCGTLGMAATMWCALNYVDAGYGTLMEVITYPNRFHGYSKYNPVEDEIYNLAVDVLTRWQKEHQGASAEEVGRVLPKKYLYFHGDGVRNYFRDEYVNGTYWDWSLPNPYEAEEE